MGSNKLVCYKKVTQNHLKLKFLKEKYQLNYIQTHIHILLIKHNLYQLNSKQP